MANKNTKTSKAGKTQNIEAPIAQEVVAAVENIEQAIAEEPVEAPKAEKTLKKSLSDEALQLRLAAARTRKGEVVRFLCTKTGDWTIGLIRTARLDKRSGFIQFRIEVLEYPLEDPAPSTFIPTGIWKSEQEEVQVRRTGILWGKGDDSADLQVVGSYTASPKAPKEEPEKPAEPAEKPAKKSSKKAPKKTTPEEEAMKAAMADMTAEGLM